LSPATARAPFFDATGARITELPITPERIALALVAREGGPKQ
jgi:CO/xanthine dehydrogenase Mo-binding subunit